MKRFSFSVSILLAIVVLTLTCCTEETTVVQPNDTDAVHLTGTVYAWECDHLYPFNQGCGESAKITLVKDNGFTSWFFTDSGSSFERYVSAGTYLAIIESGFNWPADTIYNIHLSPGDTCVELRTRYDVLDPLHVFFSFWYDSIEARMAPEDEVYLLRLAGRLARQSDRTDILILSPRFPVDTFLIRQTCFSTWCSVTYGVPIVRESDRYHAGWNAVEAWMAIKDVLDADSAGVFPDGMYVSAGFYPCPFASGLGDRDEILQNYPWLATRPANDKATLGR